MSWILPLVSSFFGLQLYLVSSKELPAAVAFYCGRPSLRLTPVGWAQDANQPCLHTAEEALQYCRDAYPGVQFFDAVVAPYIQVHIGTWCGVNEKNCSSHNGQYGIQPWICSTRQLEPITVPVGCELHKVGISNASCEKSIFWSHLAEDHCKRLGESLTAKIDVKPCLKDGSYSSLHFLGADVVCCSRGRQPNDTGTEDEDMEEIPNGESNDHKEISLTGSVIGNEDSSLIIERDDEILRRYLKNSTSGQVNEHKTYNEAKAAFTDEFKKRENLLEQELADAESRLTEEDWLHNPEQTQSAEEDLHNEFRQKFISLQEEARTTGHKVYATHQNHLLRQMKQREQAAATVWTQAIRSYPLNITRIFQAAEQLLQVIEHDRYHLVKRFEHLRAVDPVEASQRFADLQKQLSDLDKFLEDCWAEAYKLPIDKTAFKNHVKEVRETKYAHLDASVRALTSVSSPLVGKNELPNPRRESALNAERIISKYRHHIPKIDIDKPMDEKNVTISTMAPLELPLPTQGALDSDDPVLRIPHVTDGFGVDTIWLQDHTPDPSADIFFPQMASTQTSVGHILTEATPLTDNLIMAAHLNQSPAEPVKLTVGSPINQPSRLSAAVILLIVFLCLCFIVVFPIMIRWYIQRARLRRAGYTLTVVEVDEVTDARPAPSTDVSEIDGGGGGQIARWQMNGYENPAYKYSEGAFRIAHA
ncbi:unnamed protein product [Calicophoron daubneyi]|uniref:Amyloid-beta-like protein n=1 Tax=Calicophoron daubneyi TaxID=300641 RepID=A0AAV2T3C5_CALDB